MPDLPNDRHSLGYAVGLPPSACGGVHDGELDRNTGEIRPKRRIAVHRVGKRAHVDNREARIARVVDPRREQAAYLRHWAGRSDGGTPGHITRLETPEEHVTTEGNRLKFRWKMRLHLEHNVARNPYGSYEGVFERLREVWHSEGPGPGTGGHGFPMWGRFDPKDPNSNPEQDRDGGLWIEVVRDPGVPVQGRIKVAAADALICGGCKYCSCVMTSGAHRQMVLRASHLPLDFILTHEGGHMVGNGCDMYRYDPSGAWAPFFGCMDNGPDSTPYFTRHEAFAFGEWCRGRMPSWAKC